ncbi:hypothetical protein BN1708_001471 [Verticillium longisporum]|uniref:NmrA-like domain-containing protein n=1 Tax=Verticillium longisporum TaxID=100787 RepID=A0A0G4MTD5_VERLO|nr:hypothetical protein BN1708_001471 [Verticillium longisporum]
MAHKKIIAVVGATGAQGGAVAAVFLNDPLLHQEWTVRAVTRDPSKDRAQKLKQQGADVVAADLNDKASLVRAFAGATAAFGVTDYWETLSMDTEIQQGKNLVDAAKVESAVSHFIWSSLRNVNKRKDAPAITRLTEKFANTRGPLVTQGKLAHVHQFDGKAEVEEYARQVGVPATFFLPGIYMDSLTKSFRQNPPGSPWVFALPMPETAPLPLFDVRNTGIWVKAIVRKRDQLLGKRILGATKYTTPAELVDGFTQAFPEAGRAASFFSMPHEMFLQVVQDAMGLPDWAAESILEMMRLVNEGGYFGFESLGESLAVLEDEPTAWVDFLKRNEAFKDLNSYVQSLVDPPATDPQITREMYERTEEEMEDLGLNDMKVENYEDKAAETEAGDKPEEKTAEQLQHEQKNGELMDQLIDANRR